MKSLVKALILLFSSFPVLAAVPLDPRIFAGKAAGETASVLVVMREQADLSGAPAIADAEERRRFVFEALRSRAELSQRALRARLDAAGARYRAFYLVNMVEVEADRNLAGELARRADVSVVAANLPAALTRAPRVQEAEAASPLVPAAPTAIEQNVTKIRAPEVWSQGFTGQGIVVGNADTGIAWNHPALKSHYRGWSGATATASHDYNWHDAIHNAGPPCGSDSPEPCDDDGHGTSTTSLMVGDDGAGNQVGVAPGATFIGCRNMDRGDGTPARYTECFQFFLAPTDHNGQNPRPDLGANVINNSWGCPPSEGCTDPSVLKSVVENTRAAGILVAVAASNGGPSCATLDVPSYYEASFVVGATTISDQIASFSSRGPAPADGFNGLMVLPRNPITGDPVQAPVVMRYSPSANLGAINLFGVTATRRAKAFDLFLSGNMSGTKPNGITTPFGGLMSDPFETPADHTGYLYYGGVRYNAPNEDRTKLGFEFNHGSQYWFNFAQAADDIIAPKTNTRGNVVETYLTHRINSRFIFKADFIKYLYTYSGSGWHVGAPKLLTSQPTLGFPSYGGASMFSLGLTARF